MQGLGDISFSADSFSIPSFPEGLKGVSSSSSGTPFFTKRGEGGRVDSPVGIPYFSSGTVLAFLFYRKREHEDKVFEKSSQGNKKRTKK
jgi:hypothetical protein